MNFSKEEFLKISNEFQKYHEVFSKLWKISNIVFDPATPTAQVEFSPHDPSYILKISINEDFWNSLTIQQKVFVLCHEFLHIILEHPKRVIGKDMRIANIAADLVVNQLCITCFGMKRAEIDPDLKYKWFDIELPNELTTSYFEYYYDVLKQKKDQDSLKGSNTIHSYSGFSDNEFAKLVDYLKSEMHPENLNSLQKIINNSDKNQKAGTGNSTQYFAVSNTKRKKIKFENIIKKWTSFLLEKKIKNTNTWRDKSRRYLLLPESIRLPNEIDKEMFNKSKNKLKIVFFMDLSGSCVEFAQRFFDVANGINPKYFDVEIFSFDTTVMKVNIDDKKVLGGGGTSFSILSNCVNNMEKFPDAIFVLSDGWGNSTVYQNPSKWYWFLTENSITDYIDRNSFIYNLKDFE